MKKYLLILLLSVFIIPSIAFASWWNPFSWFNGWSFHKTEIAPQIPAETQKTPEEKITELQKQIDDLKKQQTASDIKTVKKDTEKVSTPTITKETDPEKLWKLWEDYNFPIADGKSWVSLELTQPSLKETRYYRKEGNQWVRKNSGAEATQPYTLPVLDYTKYTNPITGKIYTPQEYANMMAKKATDYASKKALSDMYEDIMNEGTQYTPDQLKAIDCAYLGINCPTLHIIIDN